MPATFVSHPGSTSMEDIGGGVTAPKARTSRRVYDRAQLVRLRMVQIPQGLPQILDFPALQPVPVDVFDGVAAHERVQARQLHALERARLVVGRMVHVVGQDPQDSFHRKEKGAARRTGHGGLEN